MYSLFGFEVYARIDGFLTKDGDVLLNDPNTTSGMMPSSFFFHQAAELGLAPNELLTYIIDASLQERQKTTYSAAIATKLQAELKEKLELQAQEVEDKTRVAVIFGGYSSERHISVESGRNVLEKLSSSKKYAPFPVFLTGSNEGYSLWQVPINLVLKDNADDIAAALHQYAKHPFVAQTQHEAAILLSMFARTKVLQPRQISFDELKSMADVSFIALHGRPGEDGSLQAQFEAIGLPYNGSSVESSQLTINKFDTIEKLAANGMAVAGHFLVTKDQFEQNLEDTFSAIINQFGLPLIAKPVDDGCSSAVKKINTRIELEAYAKAIFRNTNAVDANCIDVLSLRKGEEFPAKEAFLIEELISAKGATQFMEVTVGLYTRLNQNGELEYVVLEPSEAVVNADVLSLEEKFLAGEGQNITPARFGTTPAEFNSINFNVKQQIEKAAMLLKIEGYARIDAFVRVYSLEKVEVLVIEANSLPGMTPATCIFQQAALHHLTPLAFIDCILQFALRNRTR